MRRLHGSSWNLTYDYDALDRLKSDTGGAGSRTYGYDAGGNRLSRDVDGTPTAYTYEPNTNRLDTVGGANITIDAEGRTTATATQVYHYNQAGRLASVDAGSPLAEVGRYTYDAFGLRRTKVAGGVTTVYHYDQVGHLLAETDTAGAALRIHVWADDTPVAQQVGSTLTYLHVDHLATPRWATDASGVLVWRWRSDGFGGALPEEDVDGDETNVTVDIRFPGQQFDVETGLHYNYHRYYHPSVGRYISADPIGQKAGPNLYSYVYNSPVNWIDPLGLTTLQFGISGGTLRVDPQQEGRSSYEIQATSGTGTCLNNASCADKPYEGPIPPGAYEADIGDLSDPGVVGDWLRNRLGDWGDWRVPLTPTSSTDTQGRDGFFLHGGEDPGSAGCVDVGGGETGDSNTDRLLGDLTSDPDGIVSITVVP